ncbi:AMP-dependent synthetase [Paracoccus alkanivorans]|uniref:AMP-dependent synthetase n=1 Tax=Paracoccus alkanivorans TaxID=2116655 RepID=A0A3M0MQS2_9RHOB|nr:AMP-dependent synthetase [Paracoccus alkanivorans]
MSAAECFELMSRDGDSVLHRFDSHAARDPDRLFLLYGESGERFSFAEFQKRTRQMAAGLAGLGVGKGDHVCVLSPTAILPALAMFAIWRVGAVFAPINHFLRGGFLTYQIADAAPKVVIADAAGVALLQPIRGELPDFVLAGPGGDIEILEGDDPPPILLAPSDPAAIIYTSGTTGPAKGVRLGHRWINQYCFNSRVLNTPEDAVHCDLPLYHVGGAFNLFARAAWTGCTVGLWDRFSASAFWQRIAASGASVATLLDVMIPHIMSLPARPDDAANTLNKVHIQPFNANHHAFATRFGVDFMTVGFGQTESGSVFGAVLDEFPEGQGTPADLWKGLSKADYRQAARDFGRPLFDGRERLPKGVMGAPSPLFEVAALDEHDALVPEGAVGQLCIRPRFPDLILQDYINKPEATLKVLRNCWFHTGDAVRQIDAARNLYVYVDRMGGFFRVRGENVSSFEVESVMLRHPSIRAAAAVPVPAAVGDEDDIAVFLELESGAEADLTDIRAYAEAEMPRYMRPRHIRIIDTMPVTPTSKIEKYKLRARLIAELEQEKGGSQ